MEDNNPVSPHGQGKLASLVDFSDSPVIMSIPYQKPHTTENEGSSMDMNRMTIKLQEALQTASSHAMRRSHQGIDVEHLLLAFLEQEGGIVLRPLRAGRHFRFPAVRQAAEQALAKLPQVQGAGGGPWSTPPHLPSQSGPDQSRR